MLNEEMIEDLLLAVAIQYIQLSYYKKPEAHIKRRMTRKLFFNYINKIVGEDETKLTEKIKFTVLGYVDELFTEIISEIEDNKIAGTYKEIYLSTKAFFIEKLQTQEQRFKFLNTISTDAYENLNRKRYIENKCEIEMFLEHKEKIWHFIKTIWKMMYNIDCKDIGEYLVEQKDCFFFEYPKENVEPVIILAPGNGNQKREAAKTLPRIAKMSIKPRKWYFKSELRGTFEYSFHVNKINDAKINGEYSVTHKNCDCFIIECMDCIKYDEGDMEIKDIGLEECFFDSKCKKE